MSLALGLGVASAGMGIANQIWGEKDVEKTKTNRWITNNNPLQGNIEGLEGAQRDSFTKRWTEREKTGFGKFADIATPVLAMGSKVAGSGLFSAKPDVSGLSTISSGITSEITDIGETTTSQLAGEGLRDEFSSQIDNILKETATLGSNSLASNTSSMFGNRMSPIVSNTNVDILSIYEDLIRQSK